ncbi:MAG: hypothetical protein JW723_15895 [Bacteroidales bacterium]|nr:hypothetical protein [Bacteroidales bacterium]
MSGFNHTFRLHCRLLPYYLFYSIIILLVVNTPFFWDKDVVISKRALWFIENRFSLNLPNSYDNGYAPLLSLFVAFLWKIFGKSLVVGHLLMMPFAVGLIYQLHRFLNNFSDNKRFINFTLILLLVDTTLLSQIVVVSNDLILLFFLFMSLNAILYNRRNWLYLTILLLSLSHIRGVMVCLIVFLFEFALLFNKTGRVAPIFKKAIRLIPQYLPAAFTFLAYQIYHYLDTGWIITHEGSPWIGCFETVDFKGFIFNIGILIWRLLDFGRIFFWLFLLVFLVRVLRGKSEPDSNILILGILIIISSVVLFPAMLTYKVLSSHRYLLPVFMPVTILTGYVLFVKQPFVRYARVTFLILIISMISGNFWIYPDKIAKGWDSTVAHLPFHSLRKKMKKYIETRQIPFSDIGSDVPNTYTQKLTHLTDDERYFHLKDMKTDKYIFYSNIFNMFSDEEIDELKNQWILEKEYRCIQVKVQFYRNPEWGKDEKRTDGEAAE